MKIGCLDCAFNYLPFPSFLAKPAAIGFGVFGRMKLIKRNHYLIRSLKQISSLGFDCVQVMCQDPRELPLKPKGLNEICQTLGLEICSIGGYINILGSDWDIFGDIINFASRVDTNIICLHSGMSNDKNSKEILIERLSEVVDNANHNGIKIALENSPLHLIRTDDELLDMVEGVNNLYINLDTGNLNLALCDAIKTVHKLKKYIIHTHIKDSILMKNRRVFTELGKGHVHIPEYLRALKKIGYKGSLIIEYEGFGNPLNVIKSGKEYIERELMMIG